MALGAMLIVATLSLLSWPLSRSVPEAALWFAAGTVLLVTARAGFSFVLGHRRLADCLVRRIAVIGSSGPAVRLQERLGASAAFSVVGRFDDDAGTSSRFDVEGDVEALVALSHQERLDAIVIALPYERRHELPEICLRLRRVLADVYVAPHLLDDAELLLPQTRLGPHLFAVAQRRPLNEWQRIQKAAFDRFIGLVLFVGLSPVLLGLALAIKLDSPGPVIFRQTRLGLNNQPFTVFKFRSMRTEHADLLADRQTSRGDPRVTRIGGWLRRLSLDELPQLINVLRGEMSLVGPRPHAPNTRAGGKLLGDALAEYVIRHQIKPGITGWAQVNGARGELTTLDQLRDRVRLDLDYMRRWSLLFDVRVLVLTLTREIFSRHAY